MVTLSVSTAAALVSSATTAVILAAATAAVILATATPAVILAATTAVIFAAAMPVVTVFVPVITAVPALSDSELTSTTVNAKPTKQENHGNDV